MSILALNYDNRVVANTKEMIDSMESQIDELDSAINKISSLNCAYNRQDEILDELRREKETLSNDLERLTGFKEAFGAFEERVKEVDNELAEKYSKLLSGNKMEKLFNLFTLDNLQVVLDVAGLVPVIGNIADGVNIVISALRGDMTGAVLSAVALIPIAGQVASGGKLALKYGDKASGLLKYGDEIFEWGKKKFKNGVEFAKKVWDAYISDKRVYTSCNFGGEIEKLKDAIKRVSNPEDFYRKNPSDPIRDILGSGFETNPKEWNKLINDMAANGVEIVYRDGTMAYSPGLVPGAPGQLIIDKNASMSALIHEYQHYLDDVASGLPGMRQLYEQNPRIIKELRAYMKEIKIADELGLKDVSAQLWENYRQEREYILNFFKE